MSAERKNSKNSAFSDEEDFKYQDPNVSQFEFFHNDFDSIRMPEIDQELPIKARIAVMEDTSVLQSKLNELNSNMHRSQCTDMNLKEKNLYKTIQTLQTNVYAEMAEMKKDYNHRFSAYSSK
jgi:hypothetical protein